MVPMEPRGEAEVMSKHHDYDARRKPTDDVRLAQPTTASRMTPVIAKQAKVSRHPQRNGGV